MRTNLIVLLADLFNLLVIHPAKCVTYPGPDQQIPGKCGLMFKEVECAAVGIDISCTY